MRLRRYRLILSAKVNHHRGICRDHQVHKYQIRRPAKLQLFTISLLPNLHTPRDLDIKGQNIFPKTLSTGPSTKAKTDIC